MSEAAALVAALTLERPLCIDCLVLKSGLTATTVQETLTRVRRLVHVHFSEDRCRACGNVGPVVSVDRPAR